MKLLFVNNNMHMGGVQKALCNLLWQIHGEHDITLLLFRKKGVLLSQLPPGIKVDELSSHYRYLGMKRDKDSSFIRNCYGIMTRIVGRRAVIGLMKRTQQEMDAYDAVISYLHNGRRNSFYGGCNDFVQNHCKGKKAAVIHGDLSHCGAVDFRDYEDFNCIAACSKGCAEAFRQVFPQWKGKLLLLPNCHRCEEIRLMALRDPITLPKERIHVLTVARLAAEKGLLRALDALADSGRRDIHYHIIGEGKERRKLEKKIKERALNHQVSLHGEMDNPYPWMKAVDVLLIPSYHEAAPLVIKEAACLACPVLSTETCSAFELIEEPGLGWICGNRQEALCQAFTSLSTETLSQKRWELQQRECNDKKALEAFEQLLKELIT